MSGAGSAAGMDLDLAGIPALSRAELLERWSQDWGKEPPKYVSRRLLELSAAWHLQCRMYGGPDRELRRLLRASGGSLLHQIIERIEVRPRELELQIKRSSLLALLVGDKTNEVLDEASEIAILALPFQMRRSGVEARLILNGASPSASKSDPNLLQLVCNAHRWMAEMTTGQVASVDELAVQKDIPANEISRVLPIAFLAPDITKAILLGTHPVDLNAERLKRIGKLPVRWQEQRRVLGMPS